MELVDRVALILTPKRRALDWLNALPDTTQTLTVDDAPSLRTACLVAADDETDLQDLIDAYWEVLFDEFLMRSADEASWPANRTAHTFRDWFHVDSVDTIVDMDSEEPYYVSEYQLTRCARCGTELGDDPLVLLLRPDRVERVSREALEQMPTDDPEWEKTAVFRCCSESCAAEIEAAFAKALEDTSRE